MCVDTGVLLFINTIKGNVEDILCASVCVSSHKIPRAPQAAEWCLSRLPVPLAPLVSWDVARTAHDTTGTTRGPKALSASG